MRTKAGKQNKTLPSGRGPQLGPAVEMQGPFFRLKIAGALCPGGERRGCGRSPPGHPCPNAAQAHPGITYRFRRTPKRCGVQAGRGSPRVLVSKGGCPGPPKAPSPDWGLGQPRLGTGGPGASSSRGAVRHWASHLTSLGPRPLPQRKGASADAL